MNKHLMSIHPVRADSMRDLIEALRWLLAISATSFAAVTFVVWLSASGTIGTGYVAPAFGLFTGIYLLQMFNTFFMIEEFTQWHDGALCAYAPD